MRRSILLTVIGLFALCIGLKAEVYSGACGDSIAWSLDTETGVLAIEGKGEIAFVTTYNQETEEWEQPKTWLQYKDKISSARIAEGVTCIGYEAFKDCSNLVSVSIPNSVTRIESSAFSGCSALKSLDIPNSVTHIENFAFSDCSALKSLDIPNSVTSMGQCVFDGCDSLEYEIENDVKYLSNWAVGVVKGKTSYTIRQGTVGLYETFEDAHDVEDVFLPEGLISIGSNAFSSCHTLITITIPQSVTNIGLSAFSGCSNLQSITLPDALESIDNWAFSSCNALKSVVIPKGVREISSSAFQDCPNLTSIVVSEENSIYDSRENCNAIIHTSTDELVLGNQSSTIPNTVKRIGHAAFYGCKDLKAIYIPDSVTDISNQVFEGCTDLTSIVVAKGNPVYDSRENCNAIIRTETNTLEVGCASTVIPNSVTSIGDGAFAHSLIKSVVIPKEVTEIRRNPFRGCRELTSIVVEEGNPKYDSRENCNAIIETATNTLIAGCSKTVIPNSVTAIERLANLSPQSRNDVLTMSRNDVLTIGSGVKNIGRFAFYGYHDVVCYAHVPPVCDPGAFFIWRHQNLYVPKESVEEYSKTAPWNAWTIHGFTKKTTKDGEEMLVVDALPVKPGVYRQTQYKRGDQPVEDYPFEVYKKVFGTDTVDVSDDVKKIVLKAVQMDVYAAKGQNNTMVPCFLITNPQLNVIEAGKKVFTNRWVCDMYYHKTIKHGTIVNEYYTKKFKPSTVYKEIEKVFKTKPSKKNAYLGVWKMKSNLNSTYYKIYGENYRVSMHIGRNDAQGSIETVEYLKDKTTLEGGNPCDIKWTSPDSYTLFYQWNGNTIGEIWERSSMEELGENFNRVVMNVTNKQQR